jgi:hypothetical protein
MGFGYWDLRLVMTREACDPDNRQPERDQPSMSTRYHYAYQWATVTVFVPKIVGLPDDEVEEMMVHELVHPLLGPMTHGRKGTSEFVLQVETVTTMLARAIIRTKRSILDNPEPWSGESASEPEVSDLPVKISDRLEDAGPLRTAD